MDWRTKIKTHKEYNKKKRKTHKKDTNKTQTEGASHIYVARGYSDTKPKSQWIVRQKENDNAISVLSLFSCPGSFIPTLGQLMPSDI